MYEKVVNYFEKNLCIENIYFRNKYKIWIPGIISLIIIVILINLLISSVINHLWIRMIIILLMDFFMGMIFLTFIYVIPIIKIYKEKVKIKTTFDPIGILMNEEVLGAYREMEIRELETFLKRECKIKNTESIDMIIETIDKELNEKYGKKSFIDKYFNNSILPLIVLVLTVYFTNNNEQQLSQIIAKTIIAITTIIIAGNIIFKLKHINITPVDKRQNLLQLRRVLTDIKIKWNK